MGGLSTFSVRVAQTLCFLTIIKDYVAEAALCSGESMLPTIQSDGEAILVEKFSVSFRSIRRGDIVVAISPSDPDKLICKRVVALEHDRIAVGGSLFAMYEEIPQGHVWLEGDNAAKSHDSRNFGSVPFGLLRGKAVCKVQNAKAVCHLQIWPPSEFGTWL